MSSKNQSVITAFILLLAVSIATIISTPHNSNDKEVVKLSASWSYRYSDFKEITAESDLIALIKVDGLAELHSDQNTPMSVYNVKVIEPVYNIDADNFKIKMTGAETDDMIYEIDDDPLLKKDEEFLVFCKSNEDGSYRIIGGPQGRFTYTDGKLNSLYLDVTAGGEEHTELYLIDADEVIQRVKGYINTKF